MVDNPTLKFPESGKPFAIFRVAVPPEVKGGETFFIDVVAFGRQAEAIYENLSKGAEVLIEGSLRERRWESNGRKKSKVEVVARRVRFLGLVNKKEETKEDLF